MTPILRASILGSDSSSRSTSWRRSESDFILLPPSSGNCSPAFAGEAALSTIAGYMCGPSSTLLWQPPHVRGVGRAQSSRRLSGHADIVPRIRQEVGPDFRILIEEHRELSMFFQESRVVGEPGVSAERGHKIRMIVGELVERL